MPSGRFLVWCSKEGLSVMVQTTSDDCIPFPSLPPSPSPPPPASVPLSLPFSPSLSPVLLVFTFIQCITTEHLLRSLLSSPFFLPLYVPPSSSPFLALLPSVPSVLGWGE